MKKTTILFSAALLLLTACGSDSEDDILAPAQPANTDSPAADTNQRPLTVVVGGINDVTTPDGSRVMTRASEITTSNLSDFSFNYQNNSYTATKDGGNWPVSSGESGGVAAWPEGVNNDTEITFHAYNGGTFNYNSGNPYISFTAEENAASTKDLLYATDTRSYNGGWGGTKGAVSFTFDHACAAVDFTIKAGNDVTLTAAEITGVYKTAKFNYSDNTWSELSETTDYTLLTSASISLAKDATEELSTIGTMFFIPQELTVVVHYTRDGSNKKMTFTKAVEAGKYYTPTLTIAP